jgi:hypothetical protein
LPSESFSDDYLAALKTPQAIFEAYSEIPFYAKPFANNNASSGLSFFTRPFVQKNDIHKFAKDKGCKSYTKAKEKLELILEIARMRFEDSWFCMTQFKGEYYFLASSLNAAIQKTKEILNSNPSQADQLLNEIKSEGTDISGVAKKLGF